MKEASTETMRFTFDGKLLTCELIGDVEIDVHHEEESYEVAKKITEGKKHLSLVLVSQDTSITSKAQKTSMQKNHYTHVVAQAIVIRSLAQRIIGNFMFKFIKHPRPSQLFTSKTEAVKWLNKEWIKAGLN
ncbi:MAG: hypothetical protein HY841_06040 [Bacteroidetes bacterium]|nr:hypothetical protein [Bacteroidota bacterium]